MEAKEEILKEIKILYVEDNLTTAEELGYFLKRRAGKVYIAHDGQAGLDLFEKHSPDIIIVDLFLPVMSGIEMIKRIRQINEKTPIIITSAVDDSGVILSAIDIGIHKYVLKPINTSELLNELLLLGQKILVEIEAPKQEVTFNKKELESQIKKEFSSIMKNLTGKGPKEVIVFITRGNVEIYCTEVMTNYEKTLLDNCRNIAIIEQNRRLFYRIVEPKISGLINDLLKKRVHLAEMEINLRNDCNKLIFRIDV